MKKALLILAISIQTINAHPGAAAHAHDSFFQPWAWILLPAIVAFGLIWKFNKKSYSSSKR
tara:strand:- start:18280 stop:18462 length:183 start_codon:yes stop_codon:yes gene_type:complete